MAKIFYFFSLMNQGPEMVNLSRSPISTTTSTRTMTRKRAATKTRGPESRYHLTIAPIGLQ